MKVLLYVSYELPTPSHQEEGFGHKYLKCVLYA